MDVLIRCVKTCGDIGGLRHAVLLTDFGSAAVKGMRVDDSRVIVEDGLFAAYWSLVLGVVQTRSSSMIRNSCGFPGIFAGLLHQDHEKVQCTLQHLRELQTVFDAAKGRSETTTKKIVKSCPLGTTAVRWAMKFAAAGGWSRVTEQLESFIRAMFRCPGHTKLVEDANRVLRDRESRDNPNKSLTHFTEWQSLVGAELFEQWGFKEVSWQRR